MRCLFLALVLALVSCACGTPTIWEPGDPPVSVYAPDDATWDLVQDGADLWHWTGLQIYRERDRNDAYVTVILRSMENYNALTTCDRDLGGVDFEVFIRPEVILWHSEERISTRAAAIMGHEFGHLLGIHGHLSDDKWALMTPHAIADGPTWDDYQALPFHVDGLN